jgi:hypothetical protein
MITGDLALLAASKTALAVEELHNRENEEKGKKNEIYGKGDDSRKLIM